MSEFTIPEKDELKYPIEYYYPDSEVSKSMPDIQMLTKIYDEDDEDYDDKFSLYKDGQYFRIVRDIANRILKSKEDIKNLFVELASTVYLDIDEHLYYFAFSEACILLTRKDIDMKRLNLSEYNRYERLYQAPMDTNLKG